MLKAALLSLDLPLSEFPIPVCIVKGYTRTPAHEYVEETDRDAAQIDKLSRPLHTPNNTLQACQDSLFLLDSFLPPNLRHLQFLLQLPNRLLLILLTVFQTR